MKFAKMNQDNYFIKEDYLCNTEAQSLDVAPTDSYWTPERIELSSRYQHHVYLLAAKMAKKNDYTTAMDLGCGPGTKAKSILAHAFKKLILIDQKSSKNIVEKIIPEAIFIGANLEECDIALNQKVDLIICADVVEHLNNPLPCLRFALNTIKPDGLVIFSTPERDILRGQDCMTSPHPSHVREWNSEEFKMLLEFSGFNVLRQIHFPPEKLTGTEELKRLLLQRFIKRSSWQACQVAICSKSDTTS